MEGINHNQPTLVTNENSQSFYDELKQNLMSCTRFYFSVAFINYSGLQLLLDLFKELEGKGIEGKIITSTYLNFTDVKSLRKLTEFSNIDTKIYIAKGYKGFHTKGYVFEYEDYYKIVIGSSNITQSALKTNVEWNVRTINKASEPYTQEVISAFNTLWESTSSINEEFLVQYESFLNDVQAFVRQEREIFSPEFTLKANTMQRRALESLDALRKNDQTKALVIAATGTGKTYLSAFDVEQFKAKKVLFLVHREVILNDALNSFCRILPNRMTTIFKGSQKELSAEFTFAMVPSLYSNENYTLFNKDHFDYIIADEAHRAYSPSYKALLDYFTPKFLLGMTATPERTDGNNIFELFNNNIALEVRLREALREDLVLPFHYFGIQDVTADLEHVDISKIEDVAKRLSIKTRVDLIIEKMLHYSFSGSKRKCLGFCVSKEHAHYMANEFSLFGYPSCALTGENSDLERKNAIKRLEDPKDPLEFIFTVDIFNEGIDIPSVNLVLLLRPTQSPIIFTQQLGRGLRKHPEKDFLTVLDFIGNHNRSFLIPIALSGTNYYERDSLKVQVAKDFSDIPGCTHIQMDPIVKEQILSQLERENFSAMSYLKQEYQEFKKVLGGKTPKLVDYIMHESSPDPTKFILKEDSYQEFVHKVENSTAILNALELSIQRTLDKMLPIKRLNEFVVLKELLTYTQCTFNQAKIALLKIMTSVDDDSIFHTFNYFSGNILGPNEKDTFDFITGNGKDFLSLNIPLTNTANLIETLDYGILRYQEEFGKEPLAYPYLKKYTYYKMKDMGFLTNYDKSFASIRGSGVWKNKKHYFFFVDLHKGEDIEESINYKDKLLSPTHMQWETQNKTTQDSEVGRNFIEHTARDITMHMFIRKAKVIGTQKLDYMYIGTVTPISYEGNKPITFQFKLETALPRHIYDDLTFIK